MKKGKILTVITETVEKTKPVRINEDNLYKNNDYDGHKFIDYGKNITNINVIMPSTDDTDYSIDKDKLVISWGVKFEFKNSGIDGVQIDVLGLEANLISSGDTKTPINFAEYKIEVLKEKNVESKDMQMYVDSIEIDVEQKLVNVVISI